MTVYIKKLTYEERATWGTCPVCEARHGEPCAALDSDDQNDIAGFEFDDLGNGTHIGRLFNAPHAAAVEDGEQ